MTAGTDLAHVPDVTVEECEDGSLRLTITVDCGWRVREEGVAVLFRTHQFGMMDPYHVSLHTPVGADLFDFTWVVIDGREHAMKVAGLHAHLCARACRVASTD